MKYTLTHLFFFASLLTVSGVWAQADTVTLSPVADNTIYEENNNSNSRGTQLFAGNTNNGVARRALIRFDLSGIPEGATITSASLSVLPNKGGNGTGSVHRLTADWAEGPSQGTGNQGQGVGSAAGDATWNFSNFNTTSWSAAGADFVAQASAATSLANNQTATWTGDAIVADVKFWLADSTQNFGWIIVGDENGNGTAMRFNSREGTTPPQLVITYETVTTSTQILNEQDLTVNIQPNPTTDNLFVRWTLSERPDFLNLEIHSIHGQLVRQQSMATDISGNLNINVRDLDSGWYLLTLRNEKGLRTLRFVKQ